MVKLPPQDATGIGRTTRLLFKGIRPKRRSLFILLSIDAILLAFGSYFIWTWVRARTPQSPALAATHRRPNSHDSVSLDAGRGTSNRRRRSTPHRGLARNAGDHRPIGRLRMNRQQAGRPQAHKESVRDEGLSNVPVQEDARVPRDGHRVANTTGNAPDTAPIGSHATTGQPSSGVTEAERTKYRTALRKALRSRRKNVKQCYHESLKLMGHSLSGRLLLRFRLKADGQVETVSSTQNTTGSPTLERCVLAVMKAVRFPAPPSNATEFVYPIAFKARK